MESRDKVGQFVVLQERSNGNESVGDMWTEARVFPPTATLAEVFAWVRGGGSWNVAGRTMIRPDAGSIATDTTEPF